MEIGGLRKLSLIDFPATLAAVVFTRGCSFRCGYCHNPELASVHAPGPRLSEREVCDFLTARRGQLQGVVVTGGEPTLQPDLGGFAGTIHGLGFRVKLDTNGSRPGVLDSLLRKRVVDYVAMDVKAPLRKYGAIVNAPVDVGCIAESIRLIRQSGVEYEFRTTVVRGQLDAADLLEMGRLLHGARRYVLQRFVASKHLDPAFLAASTWPTDELAAVAKQLEENVAVCLVR